MQGDKDKDTEPQLPGKGASTRTHRSGGGDCTGQICNNIRQRYEIRIRELFTDLWKNIAKRNLHVVTRFGVCVLCCAEQAEKSEAAL